jgi:hypothetical protein
LWVVAKHGNASLVAFVRSSPRFIRLLDAEAQRVDAVALARRVLELTKEIAEVDGEAALACFRSSARALQKVSIAQFETVGQARAFISTLRHTCSQKYFLSLKHVAVMKRFTAGL